MNPLALADRLVVYLEKGIRGFPEGFYNSMNYTCPGNNLTHPITWGLLVQFALNDEKGVIHVGIDVHLNTGTGERFQPDVVAYGGTATDLTPLFFIDYESPNSSDGRPISKDIDPYLAWSERKKVDVPYIVITTLPDKKVRRWSKWDCADKADYESLKQSPYKYWYPWYGEELAKRQGRTKNIALINLDGKRVRREFPV